MLFAVTLVCAQEAVLEEDDYGEYEEESEYQKVDEYTGWNYEPEKNAEAENFNVKVRLDGGRGTFALYAVGSKHKAVSLLSSVHSNSESYFMLKVGRRQYVLNYANGVLCEARKTASGVQMVYTVPEKAYFAVDFSFPDPQVDELLQNVVRVTMYTVNIGETPQAFSVKGIFDTVLGENSGNHFSTAKTEKLNRQRQFTVMKDDKWIRSAGRNAAIQFMLYGDGISVPEYVSVTSKNALAKYWVPEVVESKGFTTPSSYNNSGIGINWATAYLQPGEVDVKTFYISVAEGLVPVYAGKEPAGLELLSALEKKNPLFEALPEGGKDIAEYKVRELSPAAQSVTQEQLDPEYIQNLIDYIESIKSEEDIDYEELSSLNKELDAIFERLRSMEKYE